MERSHFRAACRILPGVLCFRRFALKPDPDRQALIDQSIARYRKRFSLKSSYLTTTMLRLIRLSKLSKRSARTYCLIYKEKVANKRSKKSQGKQDRLYVWQAEASIAACRNGRLLLSTVCLNGNAPHTIVVPARKAVLPLDAEA